MRGQPNHTWLVWFAGHVIFLLVILNCYLASKSRRWACMCMNLAVSSVNCLLKQSGSGASSSFNRDADGSLWILHNNYPTKPFQPSVWELFWKHKKVFAGLVWIASHVAPLKKCQLIETTIDNDIRTDLHAVACEFAFWTFTEKMVRTIQSRVVS